MNALIEVLAVGTRANRVLRAGLLAIYATLVIRALVAHLLTQYPFGVDLEIPLRATERWLEGGEPYLASAFNSPPGATQPFLYPPYVLPLLVPLAGVPLSAVKWAWFVILLGCAIFACQRLAIPRRWWIPLLAWPPFAEGLIGGNVQVAVFAAFVACLWGPGRKTLLRPMEQDLGSPKGRWLRGAQATAVGAVKVSQPHLWVLVLRHQPLAAAAWAGGLMAAALVLLVITGPGLWWEWIEQLRRASDPSWELGGLAIARFLPPVGIVVSVACMLLVLRLPRVGGGEALGVLSTVGAVSLHPFGLLFLIPALLRVRLEVALFAASLIATYTYEGTWAGILLAAGAWAASANRALLREPAPAP